MRRWFFCWRAPYPKSKVAVSAAGRIGQRARCTPWASGASPSTATAETPILFTLWGGPSVCVVCWAGWQGRKTRPDTHRVTQRCAPSVWGRLATCAAVGYRRRSAASAAVGRAQRAPPIGRSLPSCPTMSDLPLRVGTPFFMKFRGPKAHPNRPRKAMVCPTSVRRVPTCGGNGGRSGTTPCQSRSARLLAASVA
jgi:hypothetical protein